MKKGHGMKHAKRKNKNLDFVSFDIVSLTLIQCTEVVKT